MPTSVWKGRFTSGNEIFTGWVERRMKGQITIRSQQIEGSDLLVTPDSNFF